jgi:hypothetical protein
MKLLLDTPDLNESSRVADWIETLVFVSGRKKITKTQVRQTLAAAGAGSGDELEVALGFAYKEITRRKRIGGARYPFAVDSLAVQMDPAADSEFYKFLLLIEVSPTLREAKRQKEVDILFDNIVLAALKRYLGNGSEGLRFGSPPTGDRPTQFGDALHWLAIKTGLNVGTGKYASAAKDGGVDVVAWRPFKDRRTGFVVILAQATVRLDWFPKRTDIVETVWFSWLDTGKPAVTALAVPFFVRETPERWDVLRHTVNLILDRLRLCENLDQVTSSEFTEMTAWSRAELAKLSA